MSNGKTLPGVLSESLVLAIIPFLSYTTAYYYERYYLWHFGLSPDLIEIDLPMLIGTMQITGLSLLALFGLTRQLRPFMVEIGLAVVFMVGVAMVVQTLHEPRGTVIVVTVVLALLLVAAWYVRRNPTIADDQLKKQDPEYWKQWYRVDDKTRQLFLFFVFCMMACVMIGTVTGASHAEEQTVYLVRESTPRLAYLRRYGSRIIAVELSPQRGVGGYTLRVLPANADSSGRWTRKKIGRLPAVLRPDELSRVGY